jgi:hypothetical protein
MQLLLTMCMCMVPAFSEAQANNGAQWHKEGVAVALKDIEVLGTEPPVPPRQSLKSAGSETEMASDSLCFAVTLLICLMIAKLASPPKMDQGSDHNKDDSDDIRILGLVALCMLMMGGPVFGFSSLKGILQGSPYNTHAFESLCGTSLVAPEESAAKCPSDGSACCAEQEGALDTLGLMSFFGADISMLLFGELPDGYGSHFASACVRLPDGKYKRVY